MREQEFVETLEKYMVEHHSVILKDILERPSNAKGEDEVIPEMLSKAVEASIKISINTIFDSLKDAGFLKFSD